MSWFDSIYAQDIPHRALAVYIFLKDKANRSGESWYAVGTMAKMLKLSRRTVQRAIRDLENAGFVEKQPQYRDNGSNRSNLYRLTR